MKLKLLLFFYWCFHLGVVYTQNTITVSESSGSCYTNTVFTYYSTHPTGRHNYRNTSGGIRFQIGWSTANNRWEIVDATDMFYIFYINASRSNPDPPTSGWVNIICGPITKFVLPIELTQFDAQSIQLGNHLTWATASEKNNIGFDIERSFNGTDFQKIAFVKGAGTTNTTQQYTYTDASVQRITYYRLKQVDTDGKFAYSPVVSVETGRSTVLTAFPNPSSGKYTLQGLPDPDEALVRVSNGMGQIVAAPCAQGQLDLTALPTGIYYLQVPNGQALKLFKE